jgi:hypothetical protein
VSSYRYKAAPQFWRSFKKLTPAQKESAFEAWKIFKHNPFDPRLRTHKINRLSAILKRTVYALEIESDLRATFYIEGDIVFTTNIGSHDIYNR